jgi:hypothetical protein
MNILDTCALFKLVVYPDIIEYGSKYIIQFWKNYGALYTYDACVGECLNLFKSKRRGPQSSNKNRIILNQGYYVLVNRLQNFIRKQHSVKLINFIFNTHSHQTLAAKLLQDFVIDSIDAYLIAVTKNRYRPSLFITSDKNFIKAAQSQNIRTWYCMKPYNGT